MKTVTAIAAGLLRVGPDAKTSRLSYQVERADPALGGGGRGVAPPQEDGANTARSSYQVERADSAVGGGRRGVAPPQEDGLPQQERQ
jgi:hypothetical protein